MNFIELDDLPFKEKPEISTPVHEPYERIEEIYKALVLGTRDYLYKNNFKQAIVGMSGGIDSSLTTVIAVDALGRENVLGVSMPSRYSSSQTQSDARKLAENLGIRFKVIPIERMFQAYLETLAPVFEGTSRISPRRTFRRAYGGTYLWRCRTSSAPSSFQPATRAR